MLAGATAGLLSGYGIARIEGETDELAALKVGAKGALVGALAGAISYGVISYQMDGLQVADEFKPSNIFSNKTSMFDFNTFSIPDRAGIAVRRTMITAPINFSLDIATTDIKF